jgi:hypothetical protein
LSSAEDMSLVTTSRAASPSEPQAEEHAVEPGESETPASNPKPLLKANMVAQEVRVTATGTSTDKNAIERRLFTEETASVLICESGGVIRLSAAVAPGQLLLLKNVEAKREAVGQVKRKRADRPTSCYVELEFAEPAPRFWGREFSAAAALLPKAAQDAEAAKVVMSAEATADEPGELPGAPTEEELQAFKREVGTLQGQAALTETAAPGQQAPAALPTASSEAPSTMSMKDAPSTEAESVSDDSAGGALSKKSLPIENIATKMELTQAEQAQLPKPALDFSKSLPKPKRPLRARGSFTPGFRGGVLRLALLTTALLVTATGAAWYEHWIPWRSAAKKPADSLSAIAANAKRSPSLGGQGAATEPEFSNAKVASDAPVTSPGMPSRSVAKPNPVMAEPTDKTGVPTQPVASSGSAARLAIRKTSPGTNTAGNRSTAIPAAKAATEPVAPAAAEGDFVPPKLLNSVRAEVSINALRDFERGNVVIDAVVGSAGEVNFVSVLSGPHSLRPAAVESLKHYQYEPATRNGQPVPAHVTITIHFRFVP